MEDVLHDETLAGIVLNPDDESWFIGREILAVLLQEHEKDMRED